LLVVAHLPTRVGAGRIHPSVYIILPHRDDDRVTERCRSG
jgi:hypothetical protein